MHISLLSLAVLLHGALVVAEHALLRSAAVSPASNGNPLLLMERATTCPKLSDAPCPDGVGCCPRGVRCIYKGTVPVCDIPTICPADRLCGGPDSCCAATQVCISSVTLCREATAVPLPVTGLGAASTTSSPLFGSTTSTSVNSLLAVTPSFASPTFTPSSNPSANSNIFGTPTSSTSSTSTSTSATATTSSGGKGSFVSAAGPGPAALPLRGDLARLAALLSLLCVTLALL